VTDERTPLAPPARPPKRGDLLKKAKARAELAVREASESLGTFAEHQDPVMVIAPALAPLYRIFDRIYNGEQVFALIEGPPRHGKSSNIFHGFARHLRKHPTHLIGYGSYNQEFASQQSGIARLIAERAGVWSTEVEHGTASRFDPSSSIKHWQTPEGGGAKFVGRGGTALGLGFNLAVIDDPLKNPEEAESETILDKTWEWTLGSFFNRLEPNGSFICTHQRWNDGDPIGRFKDLIQNGYRNAPAEIADLIADVRWDIVTLKAIQDDGTPLMPRRFDRLALARIQATIGEFFWWAQYMQDPRPRGGRMFAETFPSWTTAQTGDGQDRGIMIAGEWFPVPKDIDRDGLFFVFGGDTATSDSANADATAAVLLMCWYEFDPQTLRDELRGDVIACWHDRLKSPDVVSWLARIFGSLPNALVAFETQSAGKAQFQFLQLEHPELNIVEIKTTTSKRIRANAVAAASQRGRLRLPVVITKADGAAHGYCSWVPAFAKELRELTGAEGRQDDRVDATAHAWNVALSLPRSHAAMEGEQAGEFRSMDERQLDEEADPFSPRQ
jgi:phage terminase large subunit-like protein